MSDHSGEISFSITKVEEFEAFRIACGVPAFGGLAASTGVLRSRVLSAPLPGTLHV